MPPKGVCKLCREEKELLKSHLIPKALYKLLRSAEHDPIVLTNEFAMHSSRQTKDYLLCESCEWILNDGGEMWTLPLLASVERVFPLHDLMAKMPPDVDELDVKAYASVKNPDVLPDKIGHFATGIFWKASVHSWRASQSETMIELGSYSEELRRFLLGKDAFPKYVALVVNVLPPPVELISSQLPQAFKTQNGYRAYSLYVPGIDFRLLVGKLIPESLQNSCIYHHPLRPIIVHDSSKEIAAEFRRTLSIAIKSRELMNFLNGPRPSR